MNIVSPLSTLVEVLKQVNQAAITHAARLKTNEAATRATLIDPILKSLGWDIANPDLVELEKIYGNTRLDYGLTDASGKVCVIVEAKPLGANLSNPQITTQLFSYGFTFSIQNIILTDGIIWQHYQQVSPGNITPECIDISKDDLVNCADFFVHKLDAARFRMTPPVVIPPAPGPTPPRHVPGPLPKPPVTPPQPMPLSYVPLNTLPNPSQGNKPPTAIQLPDGSIVSISHWRQILTECVKFVLNQVPTIPIPLPDKTGKKVSLLSPIKPGNGAASIQMTYNGNPVFVYINYDATNCVTNAMYILGYLPKNKIWQDVAVAF